ncbi:hypothetical protein J1N35_029606 [Gossypium stocksii]|uniref:Reverse transcriptase zinc-binding domain-containing protein n=1 Tax=Gossypium stocksii TaxID=47602 RepID=A0A9D3UZ11_9ROSI|nr:hypothetical protein J1N35_029606 [Gossypium stocksii]
MCKLKDQGRLGFRDLAKFSIALLAKQGCRLITKPDFLFARVMKAKNFPHTDFISARLESHPSFTWRSMWSARKLLEERMEWRVGNKKSINIWNEAWILGPGNGKWVFTMKGSRRVTKQGYIPQKMDTNSCYKRT